MSTILSTQGVQVYILNKTSSPSVATEIDLLRGFDGLGGSAKKIETTTFSATSTMTYLKGLIDPAQATGTLIFAFDSVAHQYLLALQKLTGSLAQTTIFVGQADGVAPPTVVAGVLTPPMSATPTKWSRSGFLTACFVMGITIKEPINDVVQADLIIQPTGLLTTYTKGELTSITH